MLGLSVFFFLFHEGWGVWAGGRKAISADLHTCSAMSGMQQGTPLNLMVVGYRLHYLTPIEKRPVGSKLRTEWDDTLVVGLWLAFKKYILVTFPNFPSCLWWGCQVHMPGGGGKRGFNTGTRSGRKGWQCCSEKTEWTGFRGIAWGHSLRWKEARERKTLRALTLNHPIVIHDPQTMCTPLAFLCTSKLMKSHAMGFQRPGFPRSGSLECFDRIRALSKGLWGSVLQAGSFWIKKAWRCHSATESLASPILHRLCFPILG